MLNRIIEWSLKNQFLVIVGMIFAILGGIWAMRTIRLDAIPDLSDVQVIIYTEYPGQAPQVVEDQITYPVSSKMLSVPFAKVVRGYSFFGFSFVYVIFEDGTDLYWARSRVLEYLNGLAGQLPDGVTPQLGPDATGVGWAFMYVLNSPQRSLADLRSYQDWYLKYGLMSVEGVSEVASLGGFVRQYQVEVDPVRLRAYDVSLADIKRAIQRSNNDVGGRLVEMGEREFMVRGLGYVKDIRDLEHIPLGTGPGGTPLSLSDVANITIGPEIRRGLADWNGEGETVGGVVVVRSGADTLATIARVKERLAELEAGLPDDVEISVGYDRTELIHESIETLTDTLIEESIIVALVCIIFLFHFRSAFVAIVSIPVSILLAFIVMRVQGLGANIMSLGGIAISIGVLVDAAVIMVENSHKHYEEWKGERSHFEIILRSAQEVGPTLFFSLLLITVSFMPVFTLQAQEGRLFTPLAFTKTYSMAMASIVAITVIPVLMFWFVRGKIHSEKKHPVSRLLRAMYTPLLNVALKWRWLVVVLAIAAVASVWFPIQHIGSEFMPPLWEGDLLYMPTTFPGISITKAKELLQQTDKIIASFPEVESVLGKIGRAETATDPAPLSMIETTIVLKDPSEWRPGMTKEKLIEELDREIQFPGLTNAWTMPIKTRIDMLSTGIKTPVGIKIGGPDLSELERIGKEVEALVKPLEGTLSAYAERVMGGSYLDFDIDREAAARYGITVGDVQDVIMSAIGGMNVSWTVEGLERYPINIRYPRELRDNVQALAETLVVAPGGAQVSTRVRRRSSPRTRVPTPGSMSICVESMSAPGSSGPGGRSRKRSICHRATRSSGRASTSTCPRPSSADRADHPPPGLPDSLLQHRIVDQDRDRPAGGAVLGGRRDLADVLPRLQLVDCSVGRSHRSCRPRCRDRGGDAALPRHRLRSLEARGQDGELGGSRRGRRPRSGPTYPAEGDDGGHHLHRAVAHPVGDRHRRRRHAAHRGADGRRHRHLVLRRAAGLSGDLLHLEIIRSPSHRALRSAEQQPTRRI
jgi:Cu(I)/Ag(I) efflux system membrane protein CusA/SilA